MFKTEFSFWKWSFPGRGKLHFLALFLDMRDGQHLKFSLVSLVLQVIFSSQKVRSCSIVQQKTAEKTRPRTPWNEDKASDLKQEQTISEGPKDRHAAQFQLFDQMHEVLITKSKTF